MKSDTCLSSAPPAKDGFPEMLHLIPPGIRLRVKVSSQFHQSRKPMHRYFQACYPSSFGRLDQVTDWITTSMLPFDGTLDLLSCIKKQNLSHFEMFLQPVKLRPLKDTTGNPNHVWSTCIVKFSRFMYFLKKHYPYLQPLQWKTCENQWSFYNYLQNNAFLSGSSQNATQTLITHLPALQIEKSFWDKRAFFGTHTHYKQKPHIKFLKYHLPPLHP